MAQWEYKIIDLGSARAEQGEIILNSLGQQGWELVAISQAMAFEESAALGECSAQLFACLLPKPWPILNAQKQLVNPQGEGRQTPHSQPFSCGREHGR
jgi:hypothetical protein